MKIRMTEKRKRILNTLKRHHGALSASDLHTKLSDIDLVTIYRNLDLFTKEKLIKTFHLSSNETQYEYQPEPHHHAVCTKCEKVIHFTAPDKKIKKLLGLENFNIEELEVTVKGVCKHQ